MYIHDLFIHIIPCQCYYKISILIVYFYQNYACIQFYELNRQIGFYNAVKGFIAPTPLMSFPGGNHFLLLTDSL